MKMAPDAQPHSPSTHCSLSEKFGCVCNHNSEKACCIKAPIELFPGTRVTTEINSIITQPPCRLL